MSPTSQTIGQWVVLIVDDHYDNVVIAKIALEFFGATVATALDGEEALAIVDATRPTIILLDLSMPVMSGWETLPRLRALPTLADVPIVAVTAHAMPGDRSRVLEAGFDAYISKPYDIRTLLEGMQAALQHKTPPPALAVGTP